MIKKNITLIASFLILGFHNISYCQGKFDKWEEIKSYHSVMSATFHPSETGDLEPIKKRSGELEEKANLLASGKIPAEFNKKDVVEAVKKLQTDSKSLNKLVKAKGSDEEIKKALIALHDTFHAIVEKCQPGDGHDHHDHDGHDHKH